MYSDDYTDYELSYLEHRINRMYKQAAEELDEKYKHYIDGYIDENGIKHKGLADRYVEEYKAYQSGKYTEQQFEAWYKAQVGRGKRWEALRDDMAKRITASNKIAVAYMNQTTPGIFIENYNFEAYRIEGSFPGAVYNLMDEYTVRNLMLQNRGVLPEPNVNVEKDERWNRDRLENALLQGILQGESIEHLSERFQEVAYMNRNSAIRNARTAVTGAQNSGRQQAYQDAEKMGIELLKEWIATLDERTRESHRKMDGMQIGQDEIFPNGLRYPGDMNGRPEEVYNCRCTIGAVLPKYSPNGRTDKRILRDEEGNWTYERSITYEGKAETQSYKEWLSSRIKEAAFNAEIPEEPKQSDYENKRLYQKAYKQYRADMKEYEEVRDKYVKKHMPEPMPVEEFRKWCEDQGMHIITEKTIPGSKDEYVDIKGVDPRMLRVYVERTTELMNEYPEVKEYYEHYSWNNKYNVGFSKSDEYFAEASYGFVFGAVCKDFENAYRHYIDEITNLELTEGDGTMNSLMDHEFGHGLYFYIKATQPEDGKTGKELDEEIQSMLSEAEGIRSYAKETPDEMFAEGFKSWYNKEDTEFAHRFEEFFMRYYR